MSESKVKITDLRATVQIQLDSGVVLEGPRGTSVEDFLLSQQTTDAPIVGAVVNAQLRELTVAVEVDSRVRPITMKDADGMRFYRRSLTFLLAAAFDELFDDIELYVDHSVTSGGYFCRISSPEKFTHESVAALEKHMLELVQADLPITRQSVPLDEAVQYMQDKGFLDKVRLLSYRTKPDFIFYKLNNFKHYHHGYMVPSTGYLRWFRLVPSADGFILCFPRRHAPTQLASPPRFPKLLGTFRQYGDWLKTLGVPSVGALNEAITQGRSREIILVSEALHESRIAEIAGMIADRKDQIHLVLVAGPSSSGKTTFSRRLSIQLLARGISPFPLEMDNFFIDREKTPLDEKGDYDFESLQAVDLDRLNHDLALLIDGQQVQLPHYDFKTGMQSEGALVQLKPGQILILEGIHGLNPELVPLVSPQSSFRIYASALTQLNLDRYNRVSTTDTRLIRRIVRDAASRGYSASDTIARWESVRRGEKRYIFPFQENADVLFNSALVYEGSALAPQVEPLLRQVPFGTDENIEAKRLLAFLEWFKPVDTRLIPDNSILREFVGKSILHKFTPWIRPESGDLGYVKAEPNIVD